MSREEILEKLKQYNPQAIILFGSAAKNRMHKDSDLDLLIVQNTNKSFPDRIREIRSNIRTNTPLDIIVLTPNEAKELPQKNSFFAQIMQEGKLIYGRV